MSDHEHTSTNGWKRQESMVLHRLERIDRELHGIDKRLRQIEGKMWVLQTKAAVFGAAAGVVPSLIFFLLRNVS
tara:strand:+ start:682 stop:903 length:222 start_codon:yes stop_codon:yes gene_type:complete